MRSTSRTRVRITPGAPMLIGFSVPTWLCGFSLKEFSGAFLWHLKLKLPSLSSLLASSSVIKFTFLRVRLHNHNKWNEMKWKSLQSPLPKNFLKISIDTIISNNRSEYEYRPKADSPTHDLPSGCRENPRLQLHWKLPCVSVHMCWHPPLLKAHSLISREKKERKSHCLNIIDTNGRPWIPFWKGHSHFPLVKGPLLWGKFKFVLELCKGHHGNFCGCGGLLQVFWWWPSFLKVCAHTNCYFQNVFELLEYLLSWKYRSQKESLTWQIKDNKG